MIQMLIGPVAKIASTWMEGRVKKAEAVTRMKVAKAEAEANIMEKKAAGEIDWDLTQAQASADSWKDEWLTIIFTLPLVLLLFGEEERVANFFSALAECPDWYQYLLFMAVSASFGIRGADKLLALKGKK